MSARGAELSAEEIKIISDYLGENFAAFSSEDPAQGEPKPRS
jgi:hypothetical protein